MYRNSMLEERPGIKYIEELLKKKQGFEFRCISQVWENAISYASQGMKKFVLPAKDELFLEMNPFKKTKGSTH